MTREAVERPSEPKQLPTTPEDSAREAFRAYRKRTRPFRSAFRGIISRREAERFVKARIDRQQRAGVSA